MYVCRYEYDGREETKQKTAKKGKKNGGTMPLLLKKYFIIGSTSCIKDYGITVKMYCMYCMYLRFSTSNRIRLTCSSMRIGSFASDFQLRDNEK